MKAQFRVGSLAVLAVWIAAVVPSAASAGKCVEAAKAEYLDCKTECREEMLIAKDACINRDHDCVQVCRAYREECELATGLEEALAACQAQLQADRQSCRDQFPPDSPEFDQCIDLAQIAAFQCRDSAREAAGPALKECRSAFRQCVRECPAGAGPVEDPRQCKLDAKIAYKTCKAQCREDFQVAKDACRNRDHACVEQCREDRQACNQPILDQLAAAIAACNATRDAAVEACRLIPDEELRDQCIDSAQVAAFVCRDQAREQARPGLYACRLQFRDCVRACPPPA